MEPWVIKDPYIGGATLVTLTRNPYYYKVDTEGNQLPYIDTLSVSVNADKQTLVLKVVNGEIDYQDRHINANANRAVFIDAAEQAKIHLVDGPNADMNTTIISLNLTQQGPDQARNLQQQGFSHRPELCDRSSGDHQLGICRARASRGRRGRARNRHTTTSGWPSSTPSTMWPRPTSIWTRPIQRRTAKTSVSGLTASASPSTSWSSRPSAISSNSTQLTAQYWQAVGVDAKVQTVDRTLFYDRKDNNEHDAAVFLGSGGMADALFEPTFYFPFWNETLFAVPWGTWYASGGKSGEEPPAAAKKQMELYRELTRDSDPAKQKELMKQILDIAADEFYAIGISTPGSSILRDQGQHAQCLSAAVRLDLS